MTNTPDRCIDPNCKDAYRIHWHSDNPYFIWIPSVLDDWEADA